MVILSFIKDLLAIGRVLFNHTLILIAHVSYKNLAQMISALGLMEFLLQLQEFL